MKKGVVQDGQFLFYKIIKIYRKTRIEKIQNYDKIQIQSLSREAEGTGPTKLGNLLIESKVLNPAKWNPF
ncbi:Uncharacterized protein BWGO95_01342 [Bacillus mycoides]|uniref:Uncharacterized protein n=1 Tax=Bacillus mycoides TaxID=1405 RepID=A0A1C4BQH7_BACMY|nr:Uncharacterized protein BWGO95_01342 [Bacillus mycoides]SCC09063.1 Uncharacterized protein BW664_01472 [Bacillus mycoides]